MALDDAMGLVMRLLAQAQALAAITARMRLTDMDGAGDPALLAQLDRVTGALGAGEILGNLSDRDRAIVVGFARSYFRQALELAEDPARPGAWSHNDPIVLQAQGSASAVVATLFAEAGLGKPDARILDVGTGVARLAIAFCEQYPAASVVGLDPWQPALVLARQNVAAAGLEDRIRLVDTPIERFLDPDGFDLVWFPSFFIPERVLAAGLANVRRSLRPGGTLVLGVSDVTDDAITGAVDDLMTVRSGGTPLTPDSAVGWLERAGFGEIREVDRTWNAPIRLVAAHSSSTAEKTEHDRRARKAETVPS